MKTNFISKSVIASVLFLSPHLSHAAGQILTGETVFSNLTFNILLGAIIFLLFVIIGITRALKGVSKSELFNKSVNAGGSSKTLGIVFLFFLSQQMSAGNGTNDKWTVAGLDMWIFLFMMSVILVEGIIIATLLYTLNSLVKSEEGSIAQRVAKKDKNILELINASVEIEREGEIMMDHDYDGIKELDNNLPPWWKYGFYLTIVVAFIYLIHFHIAKTGDLQLTEYQKEIDQAKVEVEAYMKESSGNIDETNVKLLTGADVDAGKSIFQANCAACHGKLGEGGVGPNLTDDYWMHEGSFVGIFKSIKYGWPDKGMKSWKEDFSPLQIAQLSSFLKSIIGSNPPNGKAQQGELYKENAAVTDSTAVIKDSLRVNFKADSSKVTEGVK